MGNETEIRSLERTKLELEIQQLHQQLVHRDQIANLERRKLTQEVSRIGYRTKFIATLLGVLGAFFSISMGLYTSYKNTTEATAKRIQEHEKDISIAFSNLLSANDNEFSSAILSLVPEAKKASRDAFVARLHTSISMNPGGVKSRADLQRELEEEQKRKSGGFPFLTDRYSEHRPLNSGRVHMLLTVVEQLEKNDQTELFRGILDNPNFGSERAWVVPRLAANNLRPLDVWTDVYQSAGELMRRSMASILARRGDADAIELLRNWAVSANAEVRGPALGVLMVLPPKAGLDIVIDASKSGDIDVVADALSLLREYSEHEDVVLPIAKKKLESRNPRVIHSLGRLLCSVRSDEAVQYLVELLTRGDLRHQETIVRCLASFGSEAKEALPALEGLKSAIDSQSNPFFYEEIENAIAAVSGKVEDGEK